VPGEIEAVMGSAWQTQNLNMYELPVKFYSPFPLHFFIACQSFSHFLVKTPENRGESLLPYRGFYGGDR